MIVKIPVFRFFILISSLTLLGLGLVLAFDLVSGSVQWLEQTLIDLHLQAVDPKNYY